MSVLQRVRFTPPKFLSMPACGVVFSDHGLKCVRFVRSGQYLRPEYVKILPIPEGVIVKGKVQKPDVLTDMLREVRKDVDVDFAHTVVPEEHAYLFTISLPRMEEKDVRNAIAFQIQDHVPLSSEEIVFDFEVIPAPHDKEHVHVSVVALEKGVANSYSALFSRAGLTLLSIEVEAQALARALAWKKGETAMIVSIGRTRTGISIVENSVVRYTSTLEIGGDAFTNIIARERNLPHDEADKVKTTEGLSSHTSDLYTTLANVVSAFKDEIQKRRDYWNEHIEESAGARNDIKKIILSGGNATVPGLADHLAFQTGIEVVVGDVWERAFPVDDIVPPVSHRESMRYASVIGAAMRRLV